MGDGFASWVSWVVLLAYGICIVAVSYFELSARNKTPTRTEIFFATLTKWIMRFFSGMMIVLLLVAFGYVIYSYFTNQAFDGKNTLIALVFIGFFIFCLVHYFIYGQRHKGFDINRAEYRRRKKRYHWKW